jgi:hypothetical protein
LSPCGLVEEVLEEQKEQVSIESSMRVKLESLWSKSKDGATPVFGLKEVTHDAAAFYS